MKNLLIVLLFFALTACGSAEAESPGQPGIFMDISIYHAFEVEFNKTKACTKLPDGEFSEISLVFVGAGVLLNDNININGIIAPPNTITIKTFSIMLDPKRAFRHEVIHFLLLKNTGDIGADHTSPLFGNCTLDM